MPALQYISWFVGLGLEILLIRAMLRGAWREFPFLFAYSVVLFLTTVVEVAANTGSRDLRTLARDLYWIDEIILQVLLFCVVISLIYRALQKSKRTLRLRRWVVMGAAAVFVLSFVLHFGPQQRVNAWMTRVSRDLSFCSVILDLLLWSILIARKRRDERLLLLSGALGIQFTGAAIGQSLRQLSRRTVFAGNLILVVCNLACLYVWWQTFRKQRAETFINSVGN